MRAACALEDVAAARVAVDVALGVDQRAAARAARERAQEAWLAAAARHLRCCVAPWWAALGCAVGWRESHGGVWPGRTRPARGTSLRCALSAACCPLHAVHCSGCVCLLPRGAPVATAAEAAILEDEVAPAGAPVIHPVHYPVQYTRPVRTRARLSSAPLSSIESARQ